MGWVMGIDAEIADNEFNELIAEFVRQSGVPPENVLRAQQSLRQFLDVITERVRRARIFADITVERARQDGIWGGPAHDDQHDVGDWSHFIAHQVHQARSAGDDAEYRSRMVKIAALAVAAVESLDRLTTVK